MVPRKVPNYTELDKNVSNYSLKLSSKEVCLLPGILWYYILAITSLKWAPD